MLIRELWCGQYKCQVIADSNIIKDIPKLWFTQSYDLQSVFETIIIHLQLSAFAKNDRIINGWFTKDDQGIEQACYCSNGKILFAMEPMFPREVRVYIGEITESNIRLGIQYGIMFALHQQCVGLHGVTILCGNEIIILSAPSGTGKTTLAKLLEKQCDAIVINGDFALLKPTENGVIFEPTPFCGSSGRSLNHRFRVNRIVFLGQAKENVWHSLSCRETMIRFMSNTFIPTWDDNMRQAIQDNILTCISMLKMNSYDFAPTPEAAETFLQNVAAEKRTN